MLVLLSLAATVAACGSGSGSSPGSDSGSASVVPRRVQQAIAKSDPDLAYVPTELPSGYRYSTHSAGPDNVDIWFSARGGTPDELGFHVRKAHCPGGATHTFTVNGVPVSWSGTYEDQEAWRCFTHNNVPVIVSASRSISGDSALNTPRRRHDAMILAGLAANAERIR